MGPRLSAIFAFFYKFSNSLILDNKNEFVMGPDGYSAKLFSSSKVEDFFSLKGVARQGRALERHGCSWEG